MMEDYLWVISTDDNQFLICTNKDKDCWIVMQKNTIIYEGVTPPPPQVFRDLTNEPPDLTVMILTDEKIKELLNDD
jgi:hypothetical protein